MCAAYLSIKSLNKTPQHLLNALRHNLREIANEMGAASHIKPQRIRLNQIICGRNSSAIAFATRTRVLKRLGIVKPRKNAVQAIEIVVSIPPHVPINQLAFFLAARDWLKSNFGGLLLHAVIHNDEDAPHMHALIIPLIDKRLQGNKIMGDRNRLTQLQADFHKAVCAPFGLSKPKPKNRQHLKQRAQTVIEAIERKPYLWTQADFQTTVKTCIAQNPIAFEKYAAVSSYRKPNEFVRIMTKPVKPERVKYTPHKQNAITV